MRTTSSLWAFHTSQTVPATAISSQTIWVAVTVGLSRIGIPTPCRIEWTKEPRDTEGEDRTRSSVGTCSAVGLSHVHPKPEAIVMPTTTTTGTTTVSAAIRHRLLPWAMRNWSTPMKTMAAAAGSLMVAARAHRATPAASRPSMARVIPASSSPTMSASL